ncbi:metallophosphoesterase family protein [Longispora urticae]
MFAISDVHVRYPENREVVAGLRPESEEDWLLVAGDIGEAMADVEGTLRFFASRFGTVVWTPGNHELWTHPKDPQALRGEARYRHLVELCRGLGIHTPEDPFPVYEGEGGPVTVAPLFLLYDYSFMPEGASTPAEGLEIAYNAGIVATDEALLHPDPYPDRAAWCAARVEYTEKRLVDLDGARTVLVNHFPLTREATRTLRYQEFAQWCGTTRSADWHLRFNAEVVVYGHLHIPRTTVEDGVRFEEVSIGYPRERQYRRGVPLGLRQILPA